MELPEVRPCHLAIQSFQMNAASLRHTKLMRAIEMIGARVAPVLRVRL